MTAAELGGTSKATALTGETAWRQLYDDQGTPALFNATALPAAGAWRRSELLNVSGARLFGLWISRTIDASGGTGSYPQIAVLGSAKSTEPTAIEDSWFALPVTTGTMTSVTPTGTLPTGSDFTLAPPWSYDVGRRFLLRLEAPANDTDASREGPYMFNVSLVRWIQIIAQEAGDTTNPETLDLYVNVCS
jgi:hypothetical protein